jgi:hypothetical protein
LEYWHRKLLFGAAITLFVALMMWLDDNAIRAFVGLMSAVVFHWLFNLLFVRKVLARLMRWLHLASIYLVPTTRWGDHLISFLRFVRHNRRLPNQPNGYNDRFYRLKVTDEILNPLRVFVSDKEFVKLFIRGALGEDRSATTYAVLKTPEEIEAYDFPPDCVIKPTHASQRVMFRQHGSDSIVRRSSPGCRWTIIVFPGKPIISLCSLR